MWQKYQPERVLEPQFELGKLDICRISTKVMAQIDYYLYAPMESYQLINYRLSSLWFLIGCVMSVKTGNPYDTSQSYRSLPLPSPKSLWEAPTLSAWESEYEASRVFQVRGLITLGDLIDVQRSQYTPSNARKLDEWNAGTDNIGSLLNLVGTMV